VTAIDVSDAEIAKLQELVSKPHIVRRHLALESVELTKATARAGSIVNGAITAPNILMGVRFENHINGNKFNC
jgi:hypothetical protein